MVVILLMTVMRVAATVTVTTGSASMSINTTSASGGTGAYTNVSAITIKENAKPDFAFTSFSTVYAFTLSAPSGFEFNTSQTPNVSFTGGKNIAAASATVTNSTTITVSLTSSSSTTIDGLDLIKIGDTTAIQVRPTGTTVQTNAAVTYTASTGANSWSIIGLSTGATLATLTTTAGAATKYLVTSSSYSPTAGGNVTITAQLADANNDPVATSGLVVTWTKSDAGGTFSATTSTTNVSGIATVTFTTSTV
ncbi:MAG: hypothetical protein ACR2HN_01250, partial [Tepidiformaceae bacterium]